MKSPGLLSPVASTHRKSVLLIARADYCSICKLAADLLHAPVMAKLTHIIERLILPVSDSDFRSLAQLLVDTVESGAAVSFLAPLTLEHAEDWWRNTISAAHSNAIFLVARDGEGIVGTVQLHPVRAHNPDVTDSINRVPATRSTRLEGPASTGPSLSLGLVA